MSIQSMTGFGKGEAQNESDHVLIELKSVNNRFKDMRFKLPSLFSSIEIQLRNRLSESFKRGSFEIYAHYRKAEGKNNFDELDENKIKSYVEKIKMILAQSDLSFEIRPTDFLRGEFFLEQDGAREEKMKNLATAAFDMALEKLRESREQEGEKLLAVMRGHKSNFEDHYNKIRELSKTHEESIKEKLKKSFQEFAPDLKVDQGRFLQEIVYYLEKIDIHEEIDRIGSHLLKFEKLLNSRTEIGKELDFLLQELNRETNTIGSKTILDDISQDVVQMKVHLEKIREQALNLE